MKVATIIGARPQFIKASVVTAAFQKAEINEVLIHTGQHFDARMSDVFFQDLDLPQPHHHLGIHSLSHGAMTGRMMEQLELLLTDIGPDWVCVYGDTNSTLAGALVAAKLNIPLAHIEAGLRSFNRQMPEEVNRVVTDHLSQVLFAPTPLAVQCLEQEGIVQGVHLTGDVMMDSVLKYHQKAKEISKVVEKYNLVPGQFYLATIHRPSNTDNRDRLEAILKSFQALGHSVVFPIHPRTAARIESMGLNHYLEAERILTVPPMGYLDMLRLQDSCRGVITDSGGIQKEAYILKRPCFTVRKETEWKETVTSGWNALVEPDQLKAVMGQAKAPADSAALYGAGDASQQIADILLSTPVS